MARECAIECCRGEAPTFDVAITDEAGEAVDLTGVSLEFALLEDHGEPPLVTRAIGSGVTLVSAAGGTATVTLTAAQTDREPGKYAYVLARTDAGYERVYAYGPLTIRRPQVP